MEAATYCGPSPVIPSLTPGGPHPPYRPTIPHPWKARPTPCTGPDMGTVGPWASTYYGPSGSTPLKPNRPCYGKCGSWGCNLLLHTPLPSPLPPLLIRKACYKMTCSDDATTTTPKGCLFLSYQYGRLWVYLSVRPSEGLRNTLFQILVSYKYCWGCGPAYLMVCIHSHQKVCATATD